MHTKLSRREREQEGRLKGASLKKLFSPLSCAPMEQKPYQIQGEGKRSCDFLPLNMLAGGLAAQLASHKQWHNNDSNDNSNDNNDRNYDKNHNTAAATDLVANFFFFLKQCH